MPQLDDYGERIANESLEKLEREYERIYRQAAREMREKQRKFLKEFEHEKAQRLAALDTTDEAQKAYKEWLHQQTLGKEWFEGMVDELSRKATEANESAVAALADKVPGVYAGNANYEAYAIEKSLKARTAFTLVDEDTVRNLVMGRGNREAVGSKYARSDGAVRVGGRLLPEVTFPKVDRPKDYRWNRQKFTSAITQGILQGESIPNIVKRTESIFGTNEAAAYRAARTAVGSAQNSGRFFSMQRAEDMGIITKKKWKATHDERVRDSHARLDGKEVPVNEPFESDHGPIMYPKDPAAHPSEVWNCRCTMKTEVGGFKPLAESYEKWLEIQGMSYEEWEAIVAGGKRATHAVAEGKDILGTWKRRPDKYDFEIDDVIAAQGFDGKPRIVNADEFDRAVREANGGNGLIMQRVYSAPDQATLDAYREMLYNGKWYVDCSTGGADYGQGMYCVADYNGMLTEGMRSEMKGYAELGRSRNGNTYSNVETMTLDPSAKIITYEELAQSMNVGVTPMRVAETGESEIAQRFIRNQLGLGYSQEAASWGDEISIGEYRRLRRIAADLQAEGVSLRANYSDHGSFAAASGYDAINAVGHGASGSYTVVLNRTKLIIRRPE